MCAADLKPASRSPLFLGFAFLDVAALEDRRCLGAHRLLDGGDVGQHLVLHLDQPRRVACLLLGGRRDRRDLVALVHDLLAGLELGERRLHAGRLLAAEKSIDTTRAWAWGDRRMRACSMPGPLMS